MKEAEGKKSTQEVAVSGNKNSGRKAKPIRLPKLSGYKELVPDPFNLAAL